jgi:NAD(P)H-hydrate epimerase
MIPTVTVDQMREVDRAMVEDMGIELIQMTENAGRCLAQHVRAELAGDVQDKRIVVLAGRGGNGGGGLAAARRLVIWGADVLVVLAHDAHGIPGVPGHQLAILDRMGATILAPDRPYAAAVRGAEHVIDALIGYSLAGAPTGRVAELMVAANSSGHPITALDLPSGLQGDDGTASDPTIRATTTLTLALPKAGLLRREAAAHVGRLYLADISVPPLVYSRMGVSTANVFRTSDIVPVETALLNLADSRSP